MKEKFLVKLGMKLKFLSSSEMESLSHNQAFIIGIASAQEQRQQLLLDAIKGDKYYYKLKIVDALEVSLLTLEKKYPSLRERIKTVSFINQVEN